MPAWLISIFVIVVLILASIALYLHYQLHLKRKQAKVHQQELLKEKQRKEQDAIQSVVIIARSYLAEQVELAEASLRINHLLKSIRLNSENLSYLKVFDEITTRISHIPILGEWQALDKESKLQHRQTLEKVEEEFDGFAQDAAKKLLESEPFKQANK